MTMNNKRRVRVVKKKPECSNEVFGKKAFRYERLRWPYAIYSIGFQLSTQTCGTNFKFVTVKIIILILFGFFGHVWIWKHAMCMQMASIKKVKYM